MTNTNSPIQWTDVTWSPVVGCKRVSAGCDHCYAFELHDRRHLAWKRGRWPDAPAQYHQPFSKVQLLPERLGEPLHWRKPRRVFVDSMADLFHNDVPDEFIADVFAVMAIAEEHTFQVLTKRPERMQTLLGSRAFHELVDEAVEEYHDRVQRRHPSWKVISQVRRWPMENVWLGVSVEHQQAADERIPLLLQTPAAVRFLSCEPLLGPVNLIGDLEDGAYGPIWQKRAVQTRTDYGTGTEWAVDLQCGIDWVIVGGESGPHARPLSLNWARSLVEDCQYAGAAVFVKQLGTFWAREHGAHDRHGGEIEEWPDDLRVREFPDTDPVVVTEWDVSQENARA